MLTNSNEYLATVEQVKREIKAAQYRAVVHVNTELIMLYHSIGCVINAHKSLSLIHISEPTRRS